MIITREFGRLGSFPLRHSLRAQAIICAIALFCFPRFYEAGLLRGGKRAPLRGGSQRSQRRRDVKIQNW